MKTQRGMAVAAGAVTLAAMAVTGCSVEFGAGSHHETKSYDVPGNYPSFAINGDSGKVEVVGVDRSTIRVEERLRWSNKHNKPETRRTVKNGTLTLKTKCVRTVIGFNSCGADYRVEVPRRTAVTLRANSGVIRVSDLTGDSLTLVSDSGLIRAENIRTKTPIATAESGMIRFSGQADTARLKADSGAIEAREMRARNVVANTESGRVMMGLAIAPDKVDVGVDSGKVELFLPADGTAYAIDLNSDSGGRHVDKDIRRDSASTHRITVHSESGAIDIKSRDTL